MSSSDALGLDPAVAELWVRLVQLRESLRERTWEEHRRVNPFAEDLFAWKEKGSFVGGVDVTIYDSTTIVGDVTIGDSTWIGPFCSLDGTGGLTIGSSCAISAGVHIQTHDVVRWALSGGSQPYEYAPVSIGDCTFVGVNAVVTKGVTVGDHCVVAAGAVVTSDAAPYGIVAGVPARRVGSVEIAAGAIGFAWDD
jgi:acetyltransferase-like isoleucine patch superfamily enzyme